MTEPGVNIKEGTLEEALSVLSQLPEFDELRPKDYYQDRLAEASAYILIAWAKDVPIGCKIGYDRFHDGSFYSWLGGVLPAWRQMNIAKKLAMQQEKHVREQGYASIRLKTQNRHKAMLLFAIKDGFNIYNVKPKDDLDLYRIELIKKLET